MPISPCGFLSVGKVLLLLSRPQEFPRGPKRAPLRTDSRTTVQLKIKSSSKRRKKARGIVRLSLGTSDKRSSTPSSSSLKSRYGPLFLQVLFSTCHTDVARAFQRESKRGKTSRNREAKITSRKCLIVSERERAREKEKRARSFQPDCALRSLRSRVRGSHVVRRTVGGPAEWGPIGKKSHFRHCSPH